VKQGNMELVVLLKSNGMYNTYWTIWQPPGFDGISTLTLPCMYLIWP
jgi:hypothetical protein